MRVRVRNITGNGRKIHEKCNIFYQFFQKLLSNTAHTPADEQRLLLQERERLEKLEARNEFKHTHFKPFSILALSISTFLHISQHFNSSTFYNNQSI